MLTEQGGQYYAASWFGQQATEKGLKALYVERNAALAPRTHDLSFLGHQLTVPAPIQTDLDALTPIFDLTRYPDAMGQAPVDLVGANDAARHLATARRVLAWIDNQLQPPPTPP